MTARACRRFARAIKRARNLPRAVWRVLFSPPPEAHHHHLGRAAW